jgi:hypothetical protein
VDAQADLFCTSRRPNPLDQGSPADDLGSLLHQNDEEIHGTRAERYDPCAMCQKPVSDRQFQRAEAQHLAALVAHGMFSTMPVLKAASPGIPRSRRQFAGL